MSDASGRHRNKTFFFPTLSPQAKLAAGLPGDTSVGHALGEQSSVPQPHFQTPPMLSDLNDHPVPTDHDDMNPYAEAERTGWTPAQDEL